MVYLDCHCFHDPASDKGLVSHVGLHPDITKNIVQNDIYKPYVDRLIDEALLALNTDMGSGFDLGEPFDKDGKPASPQLIDDKSDQIVILCVCKSGRHRSVALSESLMYALTNMDWQHLEIVHLERKYWTQRGS